MPVPHYTYLVLKMLEPNGIIILKGSLELFDIYDNKMAQTFGTTAEYGGPKEKTERNTSSTTSRSTPDKAIDNTPEAKEIWVHTDDPNNSTPNESSNPTA
jgi:hypothetical protein